MNCPRNYKEICKEIYSGNGLLCPYKYKPNIIKQYVCVFKRRK